MKQYKWEIIAFFIGWFLALVTCISAIMLYDFPKYRPEIKIISQSKNGGVTNVLYTEGKDTLAWDGLNDRELEMFKVLTNTK